MQQNQFESYEQLSENKFLLFDSEPHKGKPKRSLQSLKYHLYDEKDVSNFDLNSAYLSVTK